MNVTTHPDTHSETSELTAKDLRKIQALVEYQIRLCDQMQELAEEHQQRDSASPNKPISLWDTSRPKVPDMAQGLVEQLKSVR